jgi:hypothetical protein
LKKHEKMTLQEARGNQRKLRITDNPEHLVLPKRKWSKSNILSRHTIDKTAAIIVSPREINQKRKSAKPKERSPERMPEEHKNQRQPELFDQKEVFVKEKKVFQGISPFARANKKRSQLDMLFDRY